MSERTKAALAAKRARGERLGQKPLAETDPDTFAMIRGLYASGKYSHVTLAKHLEDKGIKTKRGCTKWNPIVVGRIVEVL